ncbi:MAG: acyl-[acyl-carrier-protein]--UDP-N-acetylglucosamine O-acyltransferase [Candidatus Raymondbacteria bacterium RifOxyA12_full_50_37]|uniref:Acyl-[acyl-carrier-protein]--UDP-N-acetylglucosamine O-acyltransferase n=1 Tax=Candidatus Raymondbacteria bacterium RIFOXYD12_FULL_49_13 TaxID=1817890 RepID=A0A1F7FJX7_UNCRA|nr:MAG: acyl-[acyl-carrier-protein]--UDP-N-acetylglucosamine O-acyltransferase [Candidatus Raymondbacteria bacterium RifOxyB12_full_50_8]OGJ91750.1 MAG: acyl-[acyl-carrier-protein]--UDP-N-acetylglucosamine O-acyltransferase [Candidatus Raymondbacteria bacterium RifOxyA12_full_50_37]OGJ93510.1 MAG: acyl-[acyl-carrier-protein]--UDP-N-acetylglucosamine O-acyltransferase [Candidatus Raymondbacteria bacterium RIFOXYA2_FULL_49_16]OGJ96976.1 MAG: acyl-[acyl-carrier-protein]--UDP-N-acetylglucosamine O-a
MATIHSTAIIDPGAELDSTVDVGPYCIVGPKVKIGAGTRFMSHVQVEGPTTIGKDNMFFPFSYIGAVPVDLKYRGEESELIIGDNNNIRESVSLHRGTIGGGNITKIGNNCLIMAYVHAGHDTIIEDEVIVANATQIAGHVLIKKGARVGGVSAITQFCVIGEMAYIGASSLIHKDIPPYVSATGNPIKPSGINKVGLERKGHGVETINELKKAYKIIYMKNLTIAEAEKEIMTSCDMSLAELQNMVNFIKTSPNGIAR